MEQAQQQLEKQKELLKLFTEQLSSNQQNLQIVEEELDSSNSNQGQDENLIVEEELDSSNSNQENDENLGQQPQIGEIKTQSQLNANNLKKVEEEAKLKAAEEKQKIQKQKLQEALKSQLNANNLKKVEEEAKLEAAEEKQRIQKQKLQEALKIITTAPNGKILNDEIEKKIKTIIENISEFIDNHAEQLIDEEKILLLSKAPQTEINKNQALKNLEIEVKADNHHSIKALLKKNEGNYNKAIGQITPKASQNNNIKIRTRVFKNFISSLTPATNYDKIKNILEKDNQLKASLPKISNDAFSDIKTASEVAFSLIDGGKKISEEKTTKKQAVFSKNQSIPKEKEELIKTVKVISSLIGKSKQDSQGVKTVDEAKKITSSTILSNTVEINDRRLKLLGYYWDGLSYKNINPSLDKVEELKNLEVNDNNIDSKKKFIQAVGYKFSFEIKDTDVENDIEALKYLGWTIDEGTKKPTFKKPVTYNPTSKEYLKNFINKSLNAIEVSKTASELEKKQKNNSVALPTDNNLKNILKVHKIVGLKTQNISQTI